MSLKSNLSLKSKGIFSTWTLFLLLLILHVFLPSAGAGVEPLTLRINDGAGVPGQVIAVVIRTYSPRGLTQGQICVGGGGGAPLNRGAAVLEALVDFQVFSPQGDVTADVDFDSAAGTTLLTFQSPSAGVNESDGPMAVLFYRVASEAVPGTQIELAIEPADTEVFDAQSMPVTIEPRSGTFEVQPPSAALEVSLEDGAAPPAELVEVAISTERSLPLDSGLLVLTFDPSWIADDFPQGFELLTDPRYGSLDAAWSTPSPGRIEISLSSPDHSFNRIPGDILRIRLPIHAAAEVGSSHGLSFDPSSFLVSAGGTTLDLAFEAAVIEILPVVPLFRDGFESGNSTAWSSTVSPATFGVDVGSTSSLRP